MQDVSKLRVWHEARGLALLVHQSSRSIRPRQFPGLSGQLQRAATSIGANIAEGASHESAREFGRYLQQALASAAEVEHHACAAGDLGAIELSAAEKIAARSRILQRMLVSLRRRVLAEPDPQTAPAAHRELPPKTPSNGR